MLPRLSLACLLALAASACEPAGPPNPAAAPAPSLTQPASPSNVNELVLEGTVEAPGARISVYTSASCTGTRAATALAGPDGRFAIPVTVPADSTTDLSATAITSDTGVSACSAPVRYVEDSTAPTLTIAGLSPSSPADDDTVEVSAKTAEVGITLRAHGTSQCSGAPLDEHLATTLDPTFEVTVPENQTTILRFTAVDAAGNASPCPLAGTSYREDSLAPEAPALNALPSAVSRFSSLTLTGTAEPGSRVYLARGEDCVTVGPNAVADSLGRFSLSHTVPANATWTWSALAEDAVGHRSACATPVTLTHDGLAPEAAVDAVTDGPGAADLDAQSDPSRLDATWAPFTDATGIDRYEVAFLGASGECSNPATPLAGSLATVAGTHPRTHSLTGQTLAEVRYRACVRAFDLAGNASGWQYSDGVTVDTTAPTVTSTTPTANQTNAALSTVISARFSEPIDPASGAGRLAVLRGAEVVAGTIEVVGNRLDFKPTGRLVDGAAYSVTLAAGVTDLAGNAASGRSWAFTARRAWRDFDTSALGAGATHSFALSEHRIDGVSLYLDEDGAGETVLDVKAEWLAGYTRLVTGADPVVGGVSGVTEGAVAWSQLNPGASNRGVYARPWSLAAGFTWRSESARVDGTGTTGDSQTVRTAAAANGEVMVGWLHTASDGTQSVQANHHRAGAWTGVETLQTGVLRGLALGMDEGGNTIAAWCASDGSQYRLRASRHTGTAWSSPATISGTSPNCENVRLGVQANGDALVVWTARGTTTALPWFNRFTSGSWATAAAIGTVKASTQVSSTVLAIDRQGGAVVGWLEDSDGAVVRRWSGSAWLAATTLTTDVTCGNKSAITVATSSFGNALAVVSCLVDTSYWLRAAQFLPGTGWSQAGIGLGTLPAAAAPMKVVMDDSGDGFFKHATEAGNGTPLYETLVYQ